MRLTLFVTLVGVGIGVAGCAVPEPGELYQSKLSRLLAPDVSAEDAQAVTAGNQDFAFALYHQLPQSQPNLVVSPYSVSRALAQIWGGARGDTERQIASAMRFPLDQSRFHLAFDALDLKLDQMGKGARAADGGPFQFRSVDSLFVQRGMALEPSYLDLLSQDYGAAIRGMSFDADPEDARLRINDWVDGMTSGRIKDLLEKGVVTADTRFILVDAVYLSAAWKDGFDASKTKAQDFHRLDGTTVAVQMMSREAGSSVLQGEGFTAVALPYEADGLSLLVIMPDEGRFTAMEGQMDRAFLDGVVAGLQDQKVNLSLPRFKSRYPVDLQPILTALGMGDAFTPAADLSGITGGRDLQLQSAGHQATIDVTESGTVAAAATYVGGMLTSLPPEPLRVVIDRPFLFLIREASTGTVLFLGRVEDPTAG